MSLTLYYHPLASYCWKVLIALYENETPFEPRNIDLFDPKQRAELSALWPPAKFPVLQDHARAKVVPESSIIIDYLAQHYPGRQQLLGTDPDDAREIRLRDRFFDLYIHEALQKIVGDRLRPEAKRDPHGVAQAHEQLQLAYDMLDRQLAPQPWAAGDTFSLADCAAAPALYYANRVEPLGDHKNASAYLARLHERPSFSRVFAEAQPYLKNFPG